MEAEGTRFVVLAEQGERAWRHTKVVKNNATHEQLESVPAEAADAGMIDKGQAEGGGRAPHPPRPTPTATA